MYVEVQITEHFDTNCIRIVSNNDPKNIMLPQKVFLTSLRILVLELSICQYVNFASFSNTTLKTNFCHLYYTSFRYIRQHSCEFLESIMAFKIRSDLQLTPKE